MWAVFKKAKDGSWQQVSDAVPSKEEAEHMRKGKEYLETANFDVRPAVTRSASGWSLI